MPTDYLDKISQGLLGTPQGYGLLSPQEQQMANRRALLAAGSQLMAGGGWSPQRQSFGQAFAPAVQAGQQTQDMAGQAALQQVLAARQLRNQRKPISVLDPATNQPVYIDEQDAIGRTPYTPEQSTPQQKNYEYAKQNGFQGTFDDFLHSGGGTEDPSNLREWATFSKMSPQDQSRYLEMKRNTQPIQMVEAAGGKYKLNRTTGQMELVTTAEQEGAGQGVVESGKAGGKATGEAQGAASVDLSRVQSNADQALKTIDDFKKHPGFKYVWGMASKVPTIPGTPQAGAVAYYNQIKGKTFLEAFNSLKGAGQITEVEGAKATDAIGRLDRSQSRADASKALDDLEAIIKTGVSRAKQKAAGNFTPGGATGGRPPLDSFGKP